MNAIRQWCADVAAAWNRFWFTPAEPHTLAMIRILAGLMLFYTHLVWALDLRSFLGPHSWLPADTARRWAGAAWSPLWHTESLAVLWVVHLAGMAVIAMAAVGLFTRVTTVLAWLTAVFYCHRLQGALFGLDQINVFLAMYVMLGPSGEVYSLDRVLRRRKLGAVDPPRATESANVAIRLLQLHMCVIYLFGGLGKMQGQMWWDGSAVWYAVANYEYQSLDMTWLARWPALVAVLTHVTTFWETFYCVLVWPRLTRPLVLAVAAGVHGGIALFLGMITFGLAMLIGNLAFISPATVDAIVSRSVGRRRIAAPR